jgi:uncharacterized protein with HEPN domain
MPETVWMDGRRSTSIKTLWLLMDCHNTPSINSAFSVGKSLEDFLSDIQCQDAVMRRLEIIGEAARRVSD